MRAYRVAYDGRPFHGFQRQPDVPTVETALFDALGRLDVEFEGAPRGYTAAGRTDAGVSALVQTVAFDAPEWLTPAAFTAELPDSIWVWASAEVTSNFHATHDVTDREYTYYLYAPDHAGERIGGLESTLSGRHDFHNLTPDSEGTVRTIDLDIQDSGDFLVLTVTAGGFPRYFVRRLASLVEAVLVGRSGMEMVARVLDPEPLDGPDGIASAPAHPLVLTGVEYDVEFEPDETVMSNASANFEEQKRRHRSIARVARRITAGLAFSSE